MGDFYRLFDYLDAHGGNVIQAWADGLALSKGHRARLDAKIDMLEKVGDRLFPKILQNTKSRHIMEIAVNTSQLALRPFLCRGPAEMQREFTFLFGAVEKNRKYSPRDALERADANRSDLITNPGDKRCDHEPFDPQIKTSI